MSNPARRWDQTPRMAQQYYIRTVCNCSGGDAQRIGESIQKSGLSSATGSQNGSDTSFGQENLHFVKEFLPRGSGDRLNQGVSIIYIWHESVADLDDLLFIFDGVVFPTLVKHLRNQGKCEVGMVNVFRRVRSANINTHGFGWRFRIHGVGSISYFMTLFLWGIDNHLGIVSRILVDVDTGARHRSFSSWTGVRSGASPLG